MFYKLQSKLIIYLYKIYEWNEKTNRINYKHIQISI